MVFVFIKKGRYRILHKRGVRWYKSFLEMIVAAFANDILGEALTLFDLKIILLLLWDVSNLIVIFG
jgi:hypothetical protein